MAQVNDVDERIAKLVERQQAVSVKRGEAERKYREEGQEIQFEIDRLTAMKQFGSLSPAQRQALADLAAEQDDEEDDSDG